MPVNCCVKQCSNHSLKTEKCSFYRFPQLRSRTPKLKNLSEERRRLWLAAINRKHLNTKVARVCSKHFISGKNARIFDNQNPDWVPSLHMGCDTEIKRNRKLLPRRTQKSQKSPKANKAVQRIKNAECTDRIENVQMEQPPVSEQEIYSEEEYLDEYLDEINDLEEPAHNSKGAVVIRKWKNIKDSYRKNRTQRYGPKYNKKIHDNQLMFLGKAMNLKRPSVSEQSANSIDDTLSQVSVGSEVLNLNEDSLHINENCSDFEGKLDVKQEFDTNSDIHESNDYDERQYQNEQNVFHQTTSTSQNQSPFPNFVDVNNIPPIEDRHVSFIKGVLPSLQKFDERQVLKFQKGVLELISNIGDSS